VSHPDEADLALIALGEPASPADAAHLAACSRCRSRVDQLGAVVSTARTITDEDRPVAPPAAVWEGIVAEAGLTGSQAQASVTSLDQRRRRRGPVLGWLVAAAAVGVLAGATLTTVLGSTGSNDDAQVLATAPLEPVAESAYQGTAAVEQRGTESVLRVSVPDLPAVEDGYYEVWMATPDASTMVAIGTLNPGEEAVLTLPAGMDTAAFPLVDVSVEHFDGDAGHSAVSVVRGQLPA
jgi:hypothetical protein